MQTKYLITALTCLIVIGLLGGCASIPADPQTFNSTPPVAHPVEESSGAIYQARRGVYLFEDQRARDVGDILTVLLLESTNASKTASTTTSKENTVDVDNPTLLGSAFSVNAPRSILSSTGTYTMENSLASSQNFSGEGDSSQSNSMTGSVTVTVAEVLPNGNLKVRGEKRLGINQGDEYIKFSGIVRPADIASDNTVHSTKVADATIIYVGKGAIADANAMGWLGRFFNRWWPF